MFDSERVLDDLKALDILAIARDLGREPNRQNLIHCTFHDENTPSMKLNPKTNRFKCFGCGESGSTIDLYASAGKGMQFADAIKEMKSRYLGIIDGQLPQPQRLARPVPAKIERPVVPAEQFSPIYSALQTFCRQHPPTEQKRQALDYLISRAFTLETIRHFGLFVVPDVKATADFLTATFERDQLEAAGLFAPRTDKTRGGFMFYRHPILIPYLKAGQIVNLQGRCIGKPAEGGWKYQYLRERTPATMFNLDVLSGLAAGTKVYLTEGAFDTMSVHQKGGVAVSINSATLFKPEWVALFTGLKVCFMLDADQAGQTAIASLQPLFQKQGIPVSMKSLPADCKDVNDWLIKWSGQVNGYPAFWDQSTTNKLPTTDGNTTN